MQWDGSVAHKGFFTALGPAILAAILSFLYNDVNFEGFKNHFGGDTVNATQLWVALSGSLVFLVSFRTNKAYARFWDGTTLLHQMWGEWFDAASCLVAFTTLSMRNRKDDVLDFRHTLIRLTSLMHASALEEIGCTQDEEEGYPVLDIGNLDQSTLQYLKDCKYKKELNFNRVEVIVHMIQTLVVHHNDAGVIKIPPPILSRVFQTLSRGQVNLANCKKMTTTLFPFPYAQLIAFLLVFYMLVTPVVMACLCEKEHWAFFFTLLSIFGVSSLNYIARELEMPFGTDANDLPLVEFQEHMNNSMLMLIREECDHVAHTNEKCPRDFESTKDNISNRRPKHFLDANRPANCRISLPNFAQRTPSRFTQAPSVAANNSDGSVTFRQTEQDSRMTTMTRPTTMTVFSEATLSTGPSAGFSAGPAEARIGRAQQSQFSQFESASPRTWQSVPEAQPLMELEQLPAASPGPLEAKLTALLLTSLKQVARAISDENKPIQKQPHRDDYPVAVEISPDPTSPRVTWENEGLGLLESSFDDWVQKDKNRREDTGYSELEDIVATIRDELGEGLEKPSAFKVQTALEI